MKVLVTGATGFLGSWMVRRLTDSGCDVRIVCRKTSDQSELAGLKYEVTHGDVTDLDSMIAAAREVDSVFHFAGLIAYTRSQRQAMEKINVVGTANVVEACKKNRVRRLVHVSSVVAVGAGFDPSMVLGEESEYNLGPYNLGYAETKHDGEKLVVAAAKSGVVDAVIVNPSTVYGPGDARKGSRKTQIKVAQGKFPFYTGGGVNVAYVTDLTAATESAWKKGRTGERYILAGENVTIKTLFETIARCGGVEAPKIFLPNAVIFGLGAIGDLMEKFGKKGPMNSENARFSTSFHWFKSDKAQRELGLNITPATKSVEASVGWMREHGLLEPRL